MSAETGNAPKVETVDALVIGAGPAGLMAAETLADAGVKVVIAEQMPSPARKFLMAGKSGLNLTMDQPLDDFLQSYDAAPALLAAVQDFGPEQVKTWAQYLGQPVFTGSSGRVFPEAMKASPLLRAWLARLASADVELRRNWRWVGDEFHFATPDGPQHVRAKVAVLACGGASWARLGSDGAWADFIPADVAPFAPANCAMRVAWSDKMAAHFGAPVKNIAMCAGDIISRGEIILSQRGLEGSGLYHLGPALRVSPQFTMDLLPDLSRAVIEQRLSKPRGKNSLSNHLRKTLRLPPVKMALLREFGGDLADLPTLLKALPVRGALAPMDEAISTAGGLRQDRLNDWMLRPGVFAAGEMLDWDAPTGGYLLTACFASGRAAGQAALRYLDAQSA